MISQVASQGTNFVLLGSIQKKTPSSHPLTPREGAAPAGDQSVLSVASTNMDLLFALQIVARDAQRDLGEAGMTKKRADADAAREQMKKAMEKAREEAEKKAGWGGILGKLQTVAQIAGIVAAVASVAVSGGLSAPVVLGLAGTLLSVSAKPVGEAVGSEALTKGMFYAGAGLGLLGCGVGVAQLALGCGQTVGTGAAALNAVAKGATFVGGAATTASGYATYEVGRHDSLELEARADEKEHRARRTAHMREFDQFVQQLKDAEASFRRALTSLGKAQDQAAQSALTLATLGGRS
jgi:hypothetical protein